MREKTIRNDVIKIVVANIFSQGLLLIVTGTFWDDWFYYYRDRAGLWKEFMEAGRPSSAYWIEAVWSIPHYGYRWLVFSLFTFTALIFYAIMRSSEMFSSEEALELSILYTVIPVNDARIILCTFSYAVGLTAFLVGVYVLEMYMKDKANKKFCLRIVALSFFGYSFIIQSLLIFYGAVLSYIFYCEYQSRRKYLETIRTMIKYMDFILLPIFFWVGKQMLFPAYGAFENYNAVTMGAVAKAAFRLPLAVIKQAERNWIGIFDFALSGNIVLLFTVFFVVMVCLRFVVRLKEELNFGVDLKKYGGGGNTKP